MRLAVIMSGGSGRRFWPLSRARRPKQLVPLFDDKSLLELTIERLLGIFGAEGIWVVTQAAQAEETRRQASRYGAIRVIAEPVGKNTAPCMAYAASLARAAHGDAAIAFLPADHLVTDVAEFSRVIEAGLGFVETHDLVMALGIKPGRPATGFGYIKRGRRLETPDGLDVFKVAGFTEKPSAQIAKRYVASGGYFWNAGIFLARSSVLLEEIEAWLPRLACSFRAFEARAQGPEAERELDRCYAEAEDVSIDFGVMEKTRRACVAPADFGWDDLGSWEAFGRHLPRDTSGNAVSGCHIGVDSEDCVIYAGGKLVATLGTKGLVLVVTDDVILLTTKAEAERVKELAGLMDEKGLTHLL